MIHFYLVKIDSATFKEAIFEIIEVKENGHSVKLFDRVAFVEIESYRPNVLNDREKVDGFSEKFHLLRIETSTIPTI